MPRERDYVLGTHDEELERLGLQHRVWQARAKDAWLRAGFAAGQTIIDIGCGPGYAALDLSEIVGTSGRVIAVDRSRRFLDSLEDECSARGITNITTVEMDLDVGELPQVDADGAWSRWAFAFVKDPRDLLRRVGARLKPGAPIVFHEYFDYSTWRLAPRSPGLEGFVAVIIQSWRKSGGEPDVALDLPSWLAEVGFHVRGIRPLIDIVAPGSFIWQWPATFVEIGLERMADLGQLTRERADEIRREFRDAEQRPETLMITPAVMEIIAGRDELDR